MRRNRYTTPDDITAVATLINQHAAADAIVISIIAGVTLAQLAERLGEQRPVVRIIPNTLTDTGLGYSGVTFNHYAESDALMPFLESFGKVKILEERVMDTFTGFAAAGVNYVLLYRGADGCRGIGGNHPLAGRANRSGKFGRCC